MKALKHYAIESRNLTVKGKWIQQLLKGESNDVKELSHKKGLLFSTITLEKMIDDEIRHDRFLLTGDSSRSIRTYSSGEQRKALLNYLFQQQPDFLVLDNPFDCLDVESVQDLKSSLIAMAVQIPIVQIFKRQGDILPFITNVLVIEEEKVGAFYTIDQFRKKNLHQRKAFLQSKIPSPLSVYKDIPEKLIEIRQLEVSYEGRCILNDVNWTIGQNQFWHLKGANGSGKTTLLSMIYGDNPKAFGQDIYLFGRKKGSGESVWELKEKMGYFTPSMTELFQSNHNVEQMIISGLVDSVGLYLKPSDMQRNLAQEWLKVLGLFDRKDDRFYRLSQVDQRMVLIARAMIKHPPLLILDEPSTGLDDYHASLMVQLIQKIAAESTTSIVYVSHRKEEGLMPDFTFELVKSDQGSRGVCCSFNNSVAGCNKS